MSGPICIAARIGRVWFVRVPASGDRPAKTRWALSLNAAMHAAGLL